MFYVRNSKMIGRDHYIFKGLEDEEDSEIISSFIKQYYMGRTILPNKIMIKEEIEDKDANFLLSASSDKIEVEICRNGREQCLNHFTEQGKGQIQYFSRIKTCIKLRKIAKKNRMLRYIKLIWNQYGCRYVRNAGWNN